MNRWTGLTQAAIDSSTAPVCHIQMWYGLLPDFSHAKFRLPPKAAFQMLRFAYVECS